MSPAHRKQLRMAIAILAGLSVGTVQTKLLSHHPIANGIASGIVVALVLVWLGLTRNWLGTVRMFHRNVRAARRRDPAVAPQEDRDD
jgi:hypothetical protein